MKWIGMIPLFCVLISYGQYEVGETVVTFTDLDRDREIETFIYYPAMESGEDAALIEGEFPVVSVGHGFAMSYESYSYLWEHLVPLGFIVALPNTETGIDVSHGEFGKDLAFVIAALHTENEDESSLFFEHISPHSAVIGHSMGGGAGVLAVAESPEVTTLITLAAAETDPSAIAAANDILQPTLTIAGSADCVTPPEDHQEPIYENHNDCKAYVLIEGGTHCQFANSNFVCELGEFSCPTDGTIDEAEQHGIILGLVTDWLTAFLKNDFETWEEFLDLEGENAGYTVEIACEANGPTLSTNKFVDDRLTIYPNPTLSLVNIPNEFINLPFALFALDGKLIMSGTTGKYIDLSKIADGTYILTIEDKNGQKLRTRIQKL